MYESNQTNASTEPIIPHLLPDDPRIGSQAESADGFLGTVEAVYRFEDGYEVLVITDGTYTTEASNG